MIKVAVLMSTYNGEKFLGEQIESILSQKGNFLLDLYVRDDGSKDNTIRILNHYSQNNKLIWYTGDNLKPAKSFYNLLLNYSGYDYYAFSDQDDIWNEDKISRGVAALKKLEIPALYCSNAELVDEELKSMGRNVYRTPPKMDFQTLVCAGGLLGCTMILNDKLARRVTKGKGYPQMVLHDFYTAVVCSAIGGEIIYDPFATMKYRQHMNNVVGVSHGIVGTILGRVRDVMYREPIGIAGQAKSILNEYGNELTAEKKEWLTEIAHYRDRYLGRIKLAFSSKTNYINKNMGMKLRLSILFGNR